MANDQCWTIPASESVASLLLSAETARDTSGTVSRRILGSATAPIGQIRTAPSALAAAIDGGCGTQANSRIGTGPASKPGSVTPSAVRTATTRPFSPAPYSFAPSGESASAVIAAGATTNVRTQQRALRTPCG